MRPNVSRLSSEPTTFVAVPLSPSKGVKKNIMKTLVSMVALALAFAFTGPSFAGDVTKATTKASCEKAGGMWDAAKYKCSEKKQ
jgi:hypothetical protein